jgi:hypothetical protein
MSSPAYRATLLNHNKAARHSEYIASLQWQMSDYESALIMRT